MMKMIDGALLHVDHHFDMAKLNFATKLVNESLS